MSPPVLLLSIPDKERVILGHFFFFFLPVITNNKVTIKTKKPQF